MMLLLVQKKIAEKTACGLKRESILMASHSLAFGDPRMKLQGGREINFH